jgi:hypothetical protein
MAVNGSGSHIVLRGSQGIRDKLPKELYIEFCNEVIFNYRNYDLLSYRDGYPEEILENIKKRKH